MTLNRGAAAEGVAAAVGGYVIAAVVEAAVINWAQPTEWQLAWVSDLALATALGVVVYLWRHLLATRRELAERERAELVLQTQLSLAADIQRGLLPDLPDGNAAFECAAALRSAGKIGGDFYDFIETAPDVWTILVADVSGKGIPAAMALGVLRASFRALTRQHIEPARVATELSAVLRKEWRGGLFVTCVIATIDVADHTLTYSNAGHPPGILIQSGSVRHLDRGGLPLGLVEGAEFEQEIVSLSPGATCVLVTDGVTEAVEGTPAIEQDLLSPAAAELSAAEMCTSVMARALNGPGPAGAEHWDDDRTVVVLRLREAAGVSAHLRSAATHARSSRDERRSHQSLAIESVIDRG